MMFRGDQLRWGPSCPVWARPSKSEKIPGIVLGSCESSSAQPTYSVQHANDSSMTYHGISRNSILGFRDDTKVAVNKEPQTVPDSSSNAFGKSDGIHSDFPVSKTIKHNVVDEKARKPQVVPVSPGQSFDQDDSTNNKVPSSKRNKHVVHKKEEDRFDAGECSRRESSPNRMDINEDETETTPTNPVKLIEACCSRHLVDESSSLESNDATKRPGRKKRHNWKKPLKIYIRIPPIIDEKRIRGAIIGTGGGNHRKLQRATQCKTVLNGYPFDSNAEEGDPIGLAITGADDEMVNKAIETVQDAIIETFEPEEHGRVYYYLAKANNSTKTSQDGIVYQRLPFGTSQRSWMTVRYIGKSVLPYMALFVGRGRCGLQSIMKECSDCRIVWARESSRPHLFVYGSSVADVQKARNLVEIRLRWAKNKFDESKVVSNY